MAILGKAANAGFSLLGEILGGTISGITSPIYDALESQGLYTNRMYGQDLREQMEERERARKMAELQQGQQGIFLQDLQSQRSPIRDMDPLGVFAKAQNSGFDPNMAGNLAGMVQSQQGAGQMEQVIAAFGQNPQAFGVRPEQQYAKLISSGVDRTVAKQMVDMAQPQQSGDPSRYGTTVWGTYQNEQGKEFDVPMQLSKDGNPIPLQDVSGMRLTGYKTPEQINYQKSLGAGMGKAATVGDIERNAALGRAEGESIAGAPKELENAQYMIDILDKAIEHPGRGAATGRSGILNPLSSTVLRGTDRADYLAIQKQLEGKAFLQAFESLKGGGHITEIEGQKATDAIARLDTAQSDKEYLEALKELKSVVNTSMERIQGVSGPSDGWRVIP